jgi:1-phosphatidylinositol-4-phosphate 5-kinase
LPKMGCARSRCCWRPPAAPWESESGEVTDVLGDARLLTDFVVFLQEPRDPQGTADAIEALRDLAELELRRDDAASVAEAAEHLEDFWWAYKESPTGIGNFDDTKEWEPHELPAKEILDRFSTTHEFVTPEDEMYSFAVAAMVGLHVATVCSEVVDSSRSQEQFGEFYDDLVELNSRRYKIPTAGSAYSPKLILPDPFEIEEFAPAMFFELRSLSGISSESYMDSLCRINFEFIKFGSNSKSGEFFFFSHDQRFLLKTCTPSEAETLLRMMVDMRNRIQEEPRSMLGRYLGLYRLTMQGKQRLFFVMRAIPAIPIKEPSIYDLKGSERHRLAKRPKEKVGKDLNFHDEVGRLNLAPEAAEELMQIHKADVGILSWYDIMDYSVLLFIQERPNENEQAHAGANGMPPTCSVKLHSSTPLRRHPTMEKLAGLNRSRTALHGAMGNSVQNGTTMSSQPNDKVECIIRSGDGKQVYYFGLIDVLVDYNWYAKTQYWGTHVITCGDADRASRVPPVQYADRQKGMMAAASGREPLVHSDEEEEESV